MPNLSAPADRFDSLTGDTIRTCRICGFAGVLNRTNFYHRTDRDGNVTWVDRRCQSCRRMRDAENRAARRMRDAENRAARRTQGGRKFGVEIECIVDRYALERELRARGLRVLNAGYTHRVMSEWKIVTDASVAHGYELVSPPLKGRRGIADLEKACAALVAAGARINSACGLHVHHDVNDLDANQMGRLFRGWSANQRNIDMLVAASRRGQCRWAQPLREAEVQRVESLPATDRDTVRRHFSYVDRYRSLNVAAYPRYGTVEVRQHQGTINFSKIAAWIAFGQAMITLAKGSTPIDSASSDTNALIDRLAASGGLAADQATFLKRRAAHFTGRQPVAA